MRTALVAANWKMHGSSDMTKQLLVDFKSLGENDLSCEVVVCPPAPYLALATDLLVGSGIAVGGQEIAEYAEGAHTGDISAAMLVDCACRYVLVGHSERRLSRSETDANVLAKVRLALTAGLIPIVCVGETLAQREQGDTEACISAQLALLLASGIDLTRLVFAYEPVWAIGTGVTASPEQAQQTHAYIRGLLVAHSAQTAKNTRILYGGSVKADNAAALFAQPDIDGGLVGGASLDAQSFFEICKAV